MKPRGLYRERNGWGNQDSARVKYDEHQELDVSEDTYRAQIINRLSMNCLGRMSPRTMPRGPKAKSVLRCMTAQSRHGESRSTM
jgi:hypothetical protein